MNEMIEEEARAIFDIYEYNINFIKENFEPVEDKPGYVWFSKRHFQIISIETFAKLVGDGWLKSLYNSPLAERGDRDMKVLKTWERLAPDTVEGHKLKVTTTYMSFDKDEIDKLEENLGETTAIIMDNIKEG